MQVIWLSCSACGFYGLQSRISNRMYSEPLMYVFYSMKVLFEVISTLSKVLWPYCHGVVFENENIVLFIIFLLT